MFTSIYDDTSTATSTLVPVPINVTGEATTPTLGGGHVGRRRHSERRHCRDQCGHLRVRRRAINTPNFTIPSQSVLAFITSRTRGSRCRRRPIPTLGTHVYITNNNFFDNFDAAMQIEPNGLMAGDPLDPLVSGHPFFRGNVMQGNGIDGLAVRHRSRFTVQRGAGLHSYVGPVDGAAGHRLCESDREHGLGFDRPDLRPPRHDRYPRDRTSPASAAIPGHERAGSRQRPTGRFPAPSSP